MKKIFLTALLVPAMALAQTFPTPTFNSLTLVNPLTAANGGTGATASTGTGSVVLSNSPTLTTPNLGTPSAVTLTHGTGLPISTGVSGLGTGVAAALGNAVTGSGSPVLAISPTINTPTISSPTITGGTIAGLSAPIPIASGGTGATTATAATSNLQYLSPLSGGVARSDTSKLADLTNALDLGAVCNGATNDTSAITAMEGLNTPIGIAATGNPCLTTFSNNLGVSGPFRGPNQVKTADGNLTAPIWDVISSQPSPLGNWNASILTAFNGNLSHVPLVMGHVITGAATLGQPTSGESEIPETAMIAQYLHNSSGFECDPSGATQCRTLAAGNYFFGTQAGQADYSAWVANIFIANNNPAATSWLAAPAANIIAGQITAGANHVFMEPVGDIDCVDGGFDTACIGAVFGLDRTNNTSGLGEPWTGVRVQSTGTKNTDSFFTGAGKGTIGLDLVNTNGMPAAMAFPIGSGIFGNATNPGNFPNTVNLGNDEIVDSAGNGWEIIHNNVNALNVKSTQVAATVPILTSNTADSTSTATGSITTSGGVGVAKSVNIGGSVSAAGNDALLYQTTNALSVPNNTTTTVTTWTKNFDRVNTNFNASTGVFTAPATGFYHVDCYLAFTAGSSTVGSAYIASIIANGSSIATGVSYAETTATATRATRVSANASLAAGQTMSCNAFQNSGATLTLSGSGGANFISISRVP